MQWFLDGRKNFKGPKVELVGEVPIRAGEVRGGGQVESGGEMESDGSGAKDGGMVEKRG